VNRRDLLAAARQLRRHRSRAIADECLGSKLAPILGGKFAVDNLAVYSMAVYRVLQGQLHRQLRRSTPK